MSEAVETALRRHRSITIFGLSTLTLLAWIWLFTGGGMGAAPWASIAPPGTEVGAVMDSMPAGMDPMAAAAGWTLSRFVLTFSMWWVMMIAMMLPSAAPTILLYARAAGHGTQTFPATRSFLTGYLLAWGLFSLAASVLQLQLEQLGLFGPMLMASESRWLSSAVLIAAGLYQLSPVKDGCLRHCRNPAVFLSRHFRPGHAGALRMGLVHGTYCVGCCWLLMALLFVGGVMNLAWIAVLTLMVAAEKLFPFGRSVAIGFGILCVVCGAVLLLR